MTESIIFSNAATAILSVVAFLAMIVSYVVSDKKVAVVLQSASYLCVLAVVIYAILLGAELLEILILVLAFVFISALSFLPKKQDDVLGDRQNAQVDSVEENGAGVDEGGTDDEF